MSAEYMHIGIPITNRKPGMVYNEGAKFWVSNVDDYDYKIEYLKFEEGTPFPEEIHRNPHVAYKVDNLQKYIDDADSVHSAANYLVASGALSGATTSAAATTSTPSVLAQPETSASSSAGISRIAFGCRCRTTHATARHGFACSLIGDEMFMNAIGR